MKYRILGNTGLRVSEIGLGCEGFIGKTREETQEIFDHALANGVNCMDLYSPNPEMQQNVGRAVAPVRESFVFQAHLCTRWKDGQYEATRNLDEVKAAFDAQLQNLGTGYLDIGMIHYVDSLDTWRQVIDNGILDYALEEKAKGRIRHIGLSSHNPIVALEAIKTGKIEVLMFSVNPCYDLQPASEDVEEIWARKNYEGELTNMDPERQRLYETCQRLGVGITVMKCFGGGDLLDAKLSPAGAALTGNQCIHYALTRPAVATVLAGAHSAEQFLTSLAYEDAGEAERDYAAAFAAFPRIRWQGHCMYCSHCAPCPQKISVADVTKFLHLAEAQKGVPETVREHYALLPHHAGECVQCGVCETRCPFGVDVRANMRKAKEVFGY